MRRRDDNDTRKVHALSREYRDRTLCGRRFTHGFDDEPLVAERHEESEVDCKRCRSRLPKPLWEVLSDAHRDPSPPKPRPGLQKKALFRHI